MTTTPDPAEQTTEQDDPDLEEHEAPTGEQLEALRARFSDGGSYDR